MRFTRFCLLLHALALTKAKLVQYTWHVRETLTDYYRPADHSSHSTSFPLTAYEPGHVRLAMLANDSLPGPLIEASLGDDLEVTVHNFAQLETVDIHWHGLPQAGTPWEDGAYMTTGCGIPPVSGSHTYKFKAQLPGTRFWHSHVQHQMEKGLFGPLIVHDPNDPYRSSYDEEKVIVFHEWWTDPDALQAGSPLLYRDFRVHLVNGIFGNGTADYPYYRIEVEQGKRYRLRFIAVMGEDVSYRMTVAGHSMDIIAVEGQYTQRTTVGSIAFYIGSRYDVILRADKEPGDYLVEFTSAQREELLGELQPAMRFGFVMRYREQAAPAAPELNEQPLDTRAPASITEMDVNKSPGDVIPLQDFTLPNTTHEPIVTWLGATISPVDAPKLWTYTELGAENVMPSSPLLFTKCQCGVDERTRIVELPNGTVVDIIMNNVMDQVHPQHLHGNNFWVLGTGYSTRPALSDSEILTMPAPGLCRRNWSSASQFSDDEPVIGDPTAPFPAQVWGCPYNKEYDEETLNFETPYETDTVMVPAHSWAVVRVQFSNPGVWPFHCHKLYHMKAGMEMYFNIGPDVQPAIPRGILTHCSTCAVANQG